MLNILDLLFPKRCVACKKIGSYLCGDCFAKLKPVETPLCVMCDRPAIGGGTHPICKTRYSPDGISAAYQFTKQIKALVHTLKYRGVYDLTTLCSALVAPCLVDGLVKRQPVIVPVPLHASRLLERGFNQTELLARQLALQNNLPVRTDLVKRTINTPTQTKLNRSSRQENLKNAFAVVGDVRGMSILLVDDMVTTGATVRACTNALKRAGAKWVWVLALAQA